MGMSGMWPYPPGTHKWPIGMACIGLASIAVRGGSMKKAPLTRQSSGAAGKQLTLIPDAPFCPRLPNPHSGAGLALDALLVHKSITQVDWLQWGNGWRLAAAVMDLNYLDWEIQSELLQQPGWPKPIAVYSLSAKAKRAAYRLRRQGSER